jgi:hypothetical protein
MTDGIPLDYLPYVIQSTRLCPTVWHKGSVIIEGPEVRYGCINIFLEIRVQSTVPLNEILVFLPEDGIMDALTEGCSTEHNLRQWHVLRKRG